MIKPFRNEQAREGDKENEENNGVSHGWSYGISCY